MPRRLTTTCWSAVGGLADALANLRIDGEAPWLGGPLPVDDLALGAVAAALLAAAELAQARTGERPAVTLSAEHVALSFRSEQHQLLDGAPAPAGFAPLSRFVRCEDGWARTHGNYPHHAAALARALGIDASPPNDGCRSHYATSKQRASLDAGREQRSSLERTAASLPAERLEQLVVEAGGCAAAFRSEAAWAVHPAGAAVAASPLVRFDAELASAMPSGLPRWQADASSPATIRTRPCTGVRVLDLTRVIAGPVAGRTLAALGADVLRIDPPGMPELVAQHRDTGPGKRSALLDLADTERREALLAGADVVLLGYRPGSLARFDLAPSALAERHPDLVQVWLSAWGTDGPWAQRRGFDSLVQVASGIAARCASGDGVPGALPAQALDHATGHLIAATALRGLAARVRGEPVAPARLSLARTARLLLDAPPPREQRTDATGSADPSHHRVAFGDLTLISPPGALDSTPLRWAHGPRPLGGDPPIWS